MYRVAWSRHSGGTTQCIKMALNWGAHRPRRYLVVRFVLEMLTVYPESGGTTPLILLVQRTFSSNAKNNVANIKVAISDK